VSLLPHARAGDSHFYSAIKAECDAILANLLLAAGWILESENVFYIANPIRSPVNAGMGTRPIWRFYNQRTINHRYTTEQAVRDAMRADPLTWQRKAIRRTTSRCARGRTLRPMCVNVFKAGAHSPNMKPSAQAGDVVGDGLHLLIGHLGRDRGHHAAVDVLARRVGAALTGLEGLELRVRVVGVLARRAGDRFFGMPTPVGEWHAAHAGTPEASSPRATAAAPVLTSVGSFAERPFGFCCAK
jgi:hypothetical protein